jgi:membrane-bound lytic murein transglycosylase B
LSSTTPCRASLCGWLAAVATACTLAGFTAAAQDKDFDAWLGGLRDEALARKISPETLDAALLGIEPLEKVIELDRSQPEFTMTFAQYRERVVSDPRVDAGKRMMRRHRKLLQALHQRYGVQPRFLVALWGIESRFGEHMGSYSVVEALATLAYDGRRSKFFRGELLDALQILEEGHIEPDQMLGSWAGAMGQVQFMPSSFREYSVDFDGDARSDLWGNTGDALASAANYLVRSEWKGDQTWGREVRLPKGFDGSLIGRKVTRTLPQWQALGVRRPNGSALPSRALRASLVQPDGTGGPTYVAYDNYRALLRWNRSDFFALSVGLLSDALK